MGEANRRKKLGIPPREKQVEFPQLDKESIKKKVRATLYKYPIIPFIFYGTALLVLIGGLLYVIKSYKLF
tara:strand:- start:670 stop:879 length:210 start_codon:yes stop_codon:yes gene_type:complete